MPANQSSATLTIQTSSTTPNGTSQPLITATSGKLTNTTTVTLVVQPRGPAELHADRLPGEPGNRAGRPGVIHRERQPHGWLQRRGQPERHGSAQGRDRFVEPEQHGRRIQLRARRCRSRLPATPRPTPTRSRSPAAARSAEQPSRGRPTLTLIVQKNQGFQISGDLGTASSSPGRRAPLEPVAHQSARTSTSRSRTSRSRSRRARASRPAAARQNFKVTQVPAARYPITLPAGQTKTLDPARRRRRRQAADRDAEPALEPGRLQERARSPSLTAGARASEAGDCSSSASRALVTLGVATGAWALLDHSRLRKRGGERRDPERARQRRPRAPAPGSSTASVSWTASTLSSGAPVQGYYVTRTNTSTRRQAPPAARAPRH